MFPYFVYANFQEAWPCNISTTLNVYSHIINELDEQQNEKALGALDDLTAPMRPNANNELM